ncbi:MAG: Hpt domain-containing protein [Clostridia bacterium]
MITLEQLRTWGADVDDALPRCLNNEAFYLRLVGKAVEEPSFDRLREAVAAGDLDKAFDQAHALKGVTGNRALTPIDKPVRGITEFLRSRTEMDYQPLLSEILSQRDSLRELFG